MHRQCLKHPLQHDSSSGCEHQRWPASSLSQSCIYEQACSAPSAQNLSQSMNIGRYLDLSPFLRKSWNCNQPTAVRHQSYARHNAHSASSRCSLDAADSNRLKLSCCCLAAYQTQHSQPSRTRSSAQLPCFTAQQETPWHGCSAPHACAAGSQSSKVAGRTSVEAGEMWFTISSCAEGSLFSTLPGLGLAAARQQAQKCSWLQTCGCRTQACDGWHTAAGLHIQN